MQEKSELKEHKSKKGKFTKIIAALLVFVFVSLTAVSITSVKTQIHADGAGLISMDLAETEVIGEDVKGLDRISRVIKNIFIEIYNSIRIVATVIAVTLVAICLVLRMLSKNPRTAEQSTAWMKRVIISWFLLMMLGLFVQLGLQVVHNSGANTSSPWEENSGGGSGGTGGGHGPVGGFPGVAV